MAKSIYDELNDIGDTTEIEDVVSIVEETTGRISAIDDQLVEVIRENEKFKDDDDFDKATIKDLREHIEYIHGQLEGIKDELY